MVAHREALLTVSAGNVLLVEVQLHDLVVEVGELFHQPAARLLALFPVVLRHVLHGQWPSLKTTALLLD